MAKIKQEDLEHLTTEQLRSFYTTENWRELPVELLDYLQEGADNFDLGNRLNRLEKLTDRIVIKRFVENIL